MSDLINRVVEYARQKHAGMQYDGKDFFDTHVRHVVDTLEQFDPKDEEICAAYLHDVIEDTDATYEEIVSLFGEDIANIVSRVTDKPGKNRLERHLNTYYILRRNPSAIKVKLADRISNMTRSIGTEFSKMYKKEYVAFKFALYDGNHLDMWKKLDDLYDQIKDMK